MLRRLMCTIEQHQPNMLFRRVAGRRVVDCASCGREMIEEGRGRWRTTRPSDSVTY